MVFVKRSGNFAFPNPYKPLKLKIILLPNINEKSPQECSCITDVRNEIDRIDEVIISLLSKRFGYVKEVVKYKSNDSASIEASDRRRQMLEQRRLWAEENGLSADVIEQIYDRLVEYFIEEEKKIAKV